MPQNRIIELDETLANQIAAGEVVERPISVVKELVENSIDAGAQNIYIEIKEGGISYIEVKDDGGWIPKDDIKLAVKKYSTSKIQSLQDLYSVMTFWFRGEALASIASVSDFYLTSIQKWDIQWHELYLSHGKEVSFSPSGISQGTKIVVENLFSYTPARLNYLKQPRTEYSHIFHYIEKVALSHPHIGIQFISDGKEIYNFIQWESLQQRIYSVFWKEFSENIHAITFEQAWIILKWYITDPKIFFQNKSKQVLFINQRPISSALIYKAISDAYNRFIPPRNFPGFVLDVEIDPTQIDVNVHPRKMEIRFAQEQQIYRLFFHGIQDTLQKVSLVSSEKKDSSFSSQGNTSTSTSPQYYTGSGTKFKSYSPYKDVSSNPNQGTISSHIREIWNQNLSFQKSGFQSRTDFEKSLDLHDTPLGKIIGQIHNSYIVVETREGIQILDQHALAERIIYEKISKNSYIPQVQPLLIPENVPLSDDMLDVVQSYQEVLTSIGFDIEILPWNIIMISGIPDFVKKSDIGKVFVNILEDVSINGSHSRNLEEIRNKIFAYTACRSAIKFWDKLSLFEMNKLLTDAYLEYSSTCPHGRPVIWEVWLDELKKKYER